MKYLVASIFSFSLFAEVIPSGENLQSMEDKAAIAHRSGKGNEIVMITPIERATDIKHVFDFVLKNRGGTGLQLSLADGKKITNILNIEVMPGGTLMVILTNSMKGQIYEVVRTENVEEVQINQ